MFEPDAELFDQALTAEIYFLNRIEKRKQTLAKLLVELTGFDPSMNLRLRELEEWRESQKRVETNLDKIPLAENHIEPKRVAMSNVTGLDGGILQAALEKAKQRLAAKVMDGANRIANATSAGEAKVEGVVANLEVKIEKEIEDQVAPFVTMTNGGPV